MTKKGEKASLPTLKEEYTAYTDNGYMISYPTSTASTGTTLYPGISSGVVVSADTVSPYLDSYAAKPNPQKVTQVASYVELQTELHIVQEKLQHYKSLAESLQITVETMGLAVKQMAETLKSVATQVVDSTEQG